MTKELEQKFFDRFEFYRPELPITQSLMAFGFECGDGWFDLLWKLSERLEELEKIKIESIPIDERAKADLELKGWGYKLNVTQVKEKFGTLRFYVDNGSEEQHEAIRDAEEESSRVCEVCGKPGEIQGEGWYYTACEEHTK